MNMLLHHRDRLFTALFCFHIFFCQRKSYRIKITMALLCAISYFKGTTSGKVCFNYRRVARHILWLGIFHTLWAVDLWGGMSINSLFYWTLPLLSIPITIWKASWLNLIASACIDANFLNFLSPLTVISQHLRLDRGSETGIMATIHAYLRQTDEDVGAANTVHYGPSTNNKVIIP